jgi:hypothetical protein
MGSKSGPDLGAYIAESRKQSKKAVGALEEVSLPELQKLALERPDLILSSPEEQISGSALQDIEIDPRLAQAEMDSLSQMQELASEGLSPEDKARIESLRRMTGADEQARQARILQQMAERGSLDSGAQLAAQLSSSQGAADRQAQEAMQLAAQQSAARRNALAQAGQMSGQMGARQFQQKAQQAGAQDIVNRFNAAVAARDTGARRGQEAELTNISNTQQQYNKELAQREFQNQMAKQGAIANAYTGASQSALAQGKLAAMQPQKKSKLGAIGTLAGAGLGAAFAPEGEALKYMKAFGGIGGNTGAALGAADGGVKGMNYQAGGQGTIIESGEESFAGDQLEDNINDGEMVLNLDQQDNIADLLKELAERRRADEMVNNGEALVNDSQQEALMSVARGEVGPEVLVSDQDIVEPIEAPIEIPNEYADGGLEGPEDLLDFLDRNQIQSRQQFADDPLYQNIVGDDNQTIREFLGEKDVTIPLAEPTQEQQAPVIQESPVTQQEKSSTVKTPEVQPQVKKDVVTDPFSVLSYAQIMELGGPKKALEHLNKGQEETDSTSTQQETPSDKDGKKVTKDGVSKSTDSNELLDSLSAISNIFAKSAGARPVADPTQFQKEARQLQATKEAKNRQQLLDDLQKRRIDVQEKSLARNLEEKRLRREQREAGEKRRVTKDHLNAARGLLKDDPRFKKAVEQGMEFESVDRLLDQSKEGNQAALAALGTKLARAMGEVGVLTDTDVVRYVGGTSWGRKLKDWYSKGAEGELSEDTFKDIKSNLKTLRTKLADDTNRVYGNAKNRMKTAYPDLEDKTIKGLLGQPGITKPEEDIKMKAPKGDITEKDGKKYKWNASRQKYQLFEG